MNGLDLRQLEVLSILLEEQSVSRTALRLNITPPAVSRSLSILRDSLQDPLLVPSGRALVLTPYGHALRMEIGRILGDLELALQRGKNIVPGDLHRTFRISTGDYITNVLAGGLIERVAHEAPGVTLIFQDEVTLEGKGDKREADIAIHAEGSAHEDSVTQKLFMDQFVCVYRKRALKAFSKLTIKQFCTLPHLVVSRQGKTRVLIDEELEKYDMKRRIWAVMPGFTDAIAVARHTDCFLVLPALFMRKLVLSDAFHSALLPFKTPALKIVQSWHPRFQHDAAHRWLREMIRAFSQQVIK